MALRVIWAPAPRRPHAAPDGADDTPAALVVAAVVRRARLDAEKGDAGAARWLAELQADMREHVPPHLAARLAGAGLEGL